MKGDWGRREWEAGGGTLRGGAKLGKGIRYGYMEIRKGGEVAERG